MGKGTHDKHTKGRTCLHRSGDVYWRSSHGLQTFWTGAVLQVKNGTGGS